MEQFRPGLADLLSSTLGDILEEYEHELWVLDSPLMKDDRTRMQCLTHARVIVEDTAEEIRTTTPVTERASLARDIGATRAAGGVHPSESLLAAGVLFSTVLRTVTPRLTGDTAAEQVAMVSVTLNAVLLRALRTAADSYAGMLLNRVHEAHVEERRRLSRELHDHIGHGISVALRNLELHDIYEETDAARAAARKTTAQQVLTDTIEVVRQVIGDLRVVEPVESLEKAIELFLQQATGPNLASHVEVNGDEVWATTEVIEETFLIIREALRNVIAHASANRVLVRIDVVPGELRALVIDDGQGFDSSAIRHRGTGVMSMRERAAMLCGTLTLTSRIGQGTRLELAVPLARGT